MSIANEILRLKTAKADIKTEIQNKGVSVPSSTKIDSYPSLINQIQTFDPYNGHEYVEIGGLKWATMNIGANSVTDYGQYFQWGDTAGYTASQVGSTTNAKPFEWTDYKFGNGTSLSSTSGQTKYNVSDTKTVLDFCDDAARANWGGSWRMPTKDEYVALGNAVNTAWTEDYQGSGVAGLVCTDKTDSSKVLFFPAAGCCDIGSMLDVGDYGYYWSSSLYTSNVQYAYHLDINSNFVHWDFYLSRSIGYCVRGVVGAVHDYVEIGGAKWATMNIGANSVTDYGQYFQWGDTQGYTADQVGSGEGQKYFGWEDYKYGNGTSSPGNTGMTKYNTTDGKTVLEASDDAVRVNWGGSWKMPTAAEFQALGNAVNTAWTEDYQGSGVKGLVCTDKTDSSKVLFFPAGGFCSDGSVIGMNYGAYWSSSLNYDSVLQASNVTSFAGTALWSYNSSRDYGYSVRPVAAAVHDYVEIGGIKWATMNVGANSVIDTGLYFQWGDTQGYTADQVGRGSGKKYFGWEDYKYGNGTSSPGNTGMTKYNTTDGKTVLEASDDAVRANWFGWRSPTAAEFQALSNAVTTAWTEDYQGSGVKGLVCTDKTDSSKVLFFPASGYCSDGDGGVGSGGFYWSSSVSTNVKSAYSLNFYSSIAYWNYSDGRNYGHSVRLILD